MKFSYVFSLLVYLFHYQQFVTAIYLLVDVRDSKSNVLQSGKVAKKAECGDIWTEPDDFRCKHSCHNAKTMCLYDFHSHGKKCFCLGDKSKGKKQSSSRSIGSDTKRNEKMTPKSKENATDKPKLKEELSNGTVADARSLPNKNRKLVNQKMCGRIKSRGSRIVGGKDADIKDFPWLVMVAPLMECDGKATYCFDECWQCTGNNEKKLNCPNGKCDSRDIKYTCAGALISDLWVLTAAHCMNDNYSGYKLKSGATKRSQTKGFQINDAEKWIQHKDYDAHGDKNDIALMKMKKKFKDTPKVNTICLPLDKTKKSRYDEKDISGEYDAIIAGWGYTTKMGNQGPIADTLQKLPVKIIKHGICKNNMKGYKQVRVFNALHPDKNICAGGELEKDSCGGDSGGPLVTMKKVGAHIVYTVIGITSWGPTLCGAKKDEYGIYTNVAYFNDWILNNIS